MTERPSKKPPLGVCDHCGQGADQGAEGALRCPCGSLLARRVHNGIELKCRRCKRTVLIPIAAKEGVPAD